MTRRCQVDGCQKNFEIVLQFDQNLYDFDAAMNATQWRVCRDHKDYRPKLVKT